MTTEHMKKYSNYNFTQSVIKSGNYTLTTADEHVKLSATATLTLPATSTLTTSGKANKVYYMEIGAASVTGTFSSNSADTINQSGTTIASSTNGEFIVLKADPANNDWVIEDIAPYLPSKNIQDDAITTVKIPDGAITGAKTSLTKQYGHVTVDTTGTDPVTAYTAPVAVTITNATAISQDTNAGNMVIKNGTDTVASWAKGTAANAMTGEDGALANTAVAAAGVVTVESSTTNGDGRVTVFFEATA